RVVVDEDGDRPLGGEQMGRVGDGVAEVMQGGLFGGRFQRVDGVICAERWHSWLFPMGMGMDRPYPTGRGKITLAQKQRPCQGGPVGRMSAYSYKEPRADLSLSDPSIGYSTSTVVGSRSKPEPSDAESPLPLARRPHHPLPRRPLRLHRRLPVPPA